MNHRETRNVRPDRLSRLRAARDELSAQPVSLRRDALRKEICHRIVVTETGEFDSGGWSRSPGRRDERERFESAPDEGHQIRVACGL